MNRALAASLAILGALVLLRSLYTLVTGYVLPDEAFYYNLFLLHGGLGFSSYRPFFHLAFDLFFWGTHSLPELVVRSAVFCLAWGAGVLVVFARILKELELSERARGLSVLALPFFPVFSVMAVFFVTETMALFLGLLGILCAVKFLRSEKVRDSALSALFLVLASQTREPYMLLLVGVGSFFLLRRVSLRAFLAYAAVASIAAPLPTRLSPLAFDTPVQRFLFDYLPQKVLSLFGHGTGASAASIPSFVFFQQNHVGVVSNPQVLLVFAEGLLFGFGPLVLLVFASFFLVGRRFILFVALASLFAYFVVTDFAFLFFAQAESFIASDVFRLSSAALPSALCLGWLFSRRHAGKMFAGALMVGLLLLPAFPAVLQSSQNIAGGVDRFSFGYRAPYFRMSEVAIPGSLIITNVGLPQMEAFASFGRNVTVAGLPADRLAFRSLVSQGWSRVYLYDTWVTTLNRAFFQTCGCYPGYYVSILYSSNASLLWSDGESFAEVLVSR